MTDQQPKKGSGCFVTGLKIGGAILGVLILIGIINSAAGGGSKSKTPATNTPIAADSSSDAAASEPAVSSTQEPQRATATTVPATAVAATATGPRTSFGDGIWRVGTDIAPGTYLTPGTQTCYWQRTSGLTGGFAEILANGNQHAQVVVTILASDVGFESRRCGTWTRQ